MKQDPYGYYVTEEVYETLCDLGEVKCMQNLQGWSEGFAPFLEIVISQISATRTNHGGYGAAKMLGPWEGDWKSLFT